jgi:hypothetical protein
MRLGSSIRAAIGFKPSYRGRRAVALQNGSVALIINTDKCMATSANLAHGLRRSEKCLAQSGDSPLCHTLNRSAIDGSLNFFVAYELC